VTDPRLVLLVAYDGIQPLDLAGPHEVFAAANRLAGTPTPPYEIRVVGPTPGPVRGGGGLGLIVDGPLPDEPADTILVVGGPGSREVRHDPVLIDWLRASARTARRTCSVCTGAFVLAAAGLLDGRRVATHWSRAQELAADYPALTVDPTPLFVRDGSVWTSAGVTAGIDLALSLVEDDLGTDVAQDIARWLVLFLRRSGGQTQFAPEVWEDPPRHDALRDVVRAVRADPAGDHRLPALAARARMSERHLQRAFRTELGTTPAAFVTRVRVDAARRMLEREHTTVDVTARRCGFGTAETMRRAFHQLVGVSPDTYRSRFRLAAG
jgi:transcriptional regulator GlxA family with amidase domain